MVDDEQRARAQQEMAAAAFSEDVKKIVEDARVEYGTEAFDQSSQVLADHLKDRTNEFMAIARQFDNPGELITTLANDEQRLKRLAGMPTARVITELARIEARRAPYGHASTGNDPAWKANKSGRISDTDWKTGYGSHLSDSQWNKEFDRHMEARARRGSTKLR